MGYIARHALQKDERVLITGRSFKDGGTILHAGCRATVLRKWPSTSLSVNIAIDGITGTWAIGRDHVRPLDAVERIAELL